MMSEARKNPLPINALCEIFTVDPTSPTGIRWKRDGIALGANYSVGYPAGSIKTGGYWHTSVTYGGETVRLLVHRIVFALHHGRWPDGIIDHINGNPGDNRIDNLREATHATNAQNMAALPAHNVSGFPGVSRHAKGGWQVSIRLNKKQNYIGHFNSKDRAIVAAYEAKLRLHPCATAFAMRWSEGYMAAKESIKATLEQPAVSA